MDRITSAAEVAKVSSALTQRLDCAAGEQESGTRAAPAGGWRRRWESSGGAWNWERMHNRGRCVSPGGLYPHCLSHAKDDGPSSAAVCSPQPEATMALERGRGCVDDLEVFLRFCGGVRTTSVSRF